ncbi:MAG: FAD-dependent oxidoreductase [Flavitalea sp.]
MAKTQAQSVLQADVCIYGGTSAGVIAAYTVKKLGRSVILIEPGSHLGGLSSGGLGYTDIGNKYVVTGLGLDFYRKMGKYYGKPESWIFEPHVAEQAFQQYLQSADVQPHYRHQLVSVKKENGFIREVKAEYINSLGKRSTQIIQAKYFIDCSYEGDLMAKAGVSYTVGREDNRLYKETYNGVQVHDGHQFPDGVDPYKIPGKPESGLLWGISAENLSTIGSGDKKVQAYNFRLCLTDRPGNSLPITRPQDYDSSRYELLLRVLEKEPAKNLGAFLKIDMMPNNKTDINNNGPFSTDMIGVNYSYPEADYDLRKKMIKDHELYIKGLLYFIGHDNRMPVHLRSEMLKWGYPKDEYQNNGNWSPQAYIREARRMVGEYVMTQANCEGRETVNDGIGMAAYTMDSHNCQRVVVNGMVKNEGDVEIGGFGPYPIAYRSLIPKAAECKNLLVPVCLSASHIAYGSIRMEPVFMVLAQTAATAATMAVQAGVPVQDVSVKKLQAALTSNPLADNSAPEIVVDNEDKDHVEISGDWTLQKHIGYGPSALIASENKEDKKWVKFIPAVTRGGYYDLFAYILPGLDKAASATMVTVFDGAREKTIFLRKDAINVQGQTSGEWAPLGRFRLPAGRKAYIKISADKAGGTVLADAVLFRPEFK